MAAPVRLFAGSPIATVDTVNGADNSLASLDASGGLRAGVKVYNRGTDGVSADQYFTLKVSAAVVDHINVEAALGFSTHRWILDTGGGGGAVTSVAGLVGVITAQQLSTALVQEYYISLAAPATSLALIGMNGDVDGMYLITMEFRSAVGANSLELQLNGAATNLSCTTINNQIGGVQRADWKIADVATNPVLWSAADLYHFEGRMLCHSGRIRYMIGSAFAVKAGVNQAYVFYGKYNDTATNITGLSMIAGVAAGMAAGSYIHCVRVQTNNPLA